MKNSIYILHYVLVILAVHYLYNPNTQKPTHKNRTHYISSAPGISGVDNSDDKVQLSIFKLRASRHRIIAFKTSIKPRIKLRYSGGSCEYQLNNTPAVAGIIPFNITVNAAYFLSFSTLRFFSAFSLRGPPSLLC